MDHIGLKILRITVERMGDAKKGGDQKAKMVV